MQLVKRPSSPYWYVRVQRNGKDFLRSTRETNKTRASERATLLLNGIQDEAYGRARPSEDLWLTDWWDDYWAGRRGTSSARVAAPTTARVQKHLGQLRLHEVKPSHLRAYITTRLAEGASPTTVWHEGAQLRQVFRAALADHLLTHSPFASKEVKWPKPGRRERVLTREEEDHLLAAANPTYAAMITVALHSGLRAGELVVLRVEDLHWEAQWMRVVGKGKKVRQVPLFPQALAALRKHVGTRTKGRVFPSTRGGEVDTRHAVIRMNQVLKQAWWRADLPRPHVSMHVFRHTFATRFLQAGGNIYVLSKILGHSSVRVTEQVYSHVTHLDVVAQALLVDLTAGGNPSQKS